MNEPQARIRIHTTEEIRTTKIVPIAKVLERIAARIPTMVVLRIRTMAVKVLIKVIERVMVVKVTKIVTSETSSEEIVRLRLKMKEKAVSKLTSQVAVEASLSSFA